MRWFFLKILIYYHVYKSKFKQGVSKLLDFMPWVIVLKNDGAILI